MTTRKTKHVGEFLRKFNLKGGAKEIPDLGKIKLENLYIDYPGGSDALESVPGYRKICSFDNGIHSIFRVSTKNGVDYIYIHSGRYLYRFAKDNTDNLSKLFPIAEISDTESFCLVKGSASFFSDTKRLFGFDGDGNPIEISADPLVAGCRVMELFDDRLFLSGNPEMKDKILYSTPIFSDEIAFPSDNFIEIGSGAGIVKNMISVGNQLWIFKSGNADGQILRIRKADGEGYKKELLFSDLSPICAGYRLGSIVFLSECNIYSIDAPCEDNPQIKLIAEIPLDLLSVGEARVASLGNWMGYIALMTNGKILLLDSHKSPLGIYPIVNVGDYIGDRKVYRYSHEKIEGYGNSPHTDEVAPGEIFSHIGEDGITVHYELCDDKKLLVYPTDERWQGEFLAANLFFCDRNLMWFSTERGRLFLFNNDKRGIAPDYLKSSSDFDGEEYQRLYGNLLHPYFYSFGDHRARYLMELPCDTGGCYAIRKINIPASLVVTGKRLMSSSALLTVKSDGREVYRQKIAVGEINFSDLNFSAIDLSDEKEFTVRLPHKGPLWKSKQITIREGDFRMPLSISSVSYRYIIQDEDY